MTDPNMIDFYGRAARIQKAHKKGYAFEAPGALGRSYYHPVKTRRRSFAMPVLFFVACCFLLKGLIFYSVGAESYSARVAVLMEGEGVEPLGGWLMQPEPVTLLIADQIAKGMTYLQG